MSQQLADFVRYRAEYLSGDEKGEAQIFCDRLFKALGHGGIREAGGTLEMRLRSNSSKGTAFADLIWKPRCLIEMKKKGTNLARHYRQAFDYWVQAVPDRPRYVILCNFDEFWIYDFDVQLDEPVDKLHINELVARWDALAFLLPIAEKPVFNNDLVAVTRHAAGRVAHLFTELHDRGIEREHAQSFVLQSVVAMFAEDIGLLPGRYFTRALQDSNSGSDAYDLLFGLFREMNTPATTLAGRYRGTPYFNGGLFAKIAPIELTRDELDVLRVAATTNWAAVRPEIFGTLFEGSMDKGERHAQGAHFTSQADIARVVIPTIVTPWRERLQAAGSIPELQRALDDMSKFRVLDPAAGSGNFLYVAYREMRRLEHEAITLISERRRSSAMAAQSSLAYIAPENFFGIDINPFAVEVAKVTMMLAKKLAADELGDDQDVLPFANLDRTIVAADALFTEWPNVNAIIGNPPYLGRRRMAEELGSEYTQRLAEAFPSVAGVSDFVCYWFPLVQDRLPEGGRAGLVATKTIRENHSREASLDYVIDNGGVIFDAVSSQPWSGDAIVNVSIVNWSKHIDVTPKVLWLNDGDLRLEVDSIPSSLQPTVDVRNAAAVPANMEPQTCFQGQTPGISNGYLLDAETLEELAAKDPASLRYIHPFLGGREMLQRIPIDRWVIDLPHSDLSEARVAAPGALDHLTKYVLPERKKLLDREDARNQEGRERNPRFRPESQHRLFMNRWWQQWRRRADLIDELSQIDRYIATSRVATVGRATVFSFVDSSVRPGDSLTVFTLDDDYSFGILSSAVHRAWLVARCSTLRGDLRYTSTTVWDSFPWPQSPTRAHVRSITQIVKELIELREDYLQRGQTLAAQYDILRSPGRSRLRDLHSQLDKAVMRAYGFNTEDDVLAQLLALNQDLARETGVVRGPGAEGLPDARATTTYALR
ncbi:class I SAM-dependent DNA methyltransferase [Micromonospora sicca]|uniref:site-specific DNA-methyltransferase (adenine-specific) n=1 Tax=Micromonospora sicca TaxID=2202420 RepID=A0A317D8D5_9ACTN|nr:class I SAM-dependent DNA methyltransferase [Micromonospora sp. 4G51]